ncbi:MAG: hypothetical protein J7513_17330 [Solirubrobacteraceae bacterium]|nr:hypothetical protein [Solirubrobacteraceae bacterium]
MGHHKRQKRHQAEAATNTADATPADETTPKPPEKSPAETVLEERTSLRETIKAVRDRADSTAKVVGGALTALAGYLGIAKLSDVFPLHFNGGVDVLAAVGMLGAVALLVFGVMRWIALLGWVSSPVSLTPELPEELDGPNRLSKAEIALVESQFKRHALLNGVETLQELDQNIRLQRKANESAGVADANSRKTSVPLGCDGRPSAWRPNADLDVLDAEIHVVLVRAVLDIVRFRYRRAFNSHFAAKAVAAAAIGYLGLAVSSNYLVGRSSGQLTRASECAKLVDTQLKSHLKPVHELVSCKNLLPALPSAYDRSQPTPTTPDGASKTTPDEGSDAPKGTTPVATTPEKATPQASTPAKTTP